jgi:hypothetical protein
MKVAAIALGIVLVCGQACLGDWLFQWEGTVEEIRDGLGNNVSWGGAEVGDAVSGSLQYDPANFGPGDDKGWGDAVISDGLDYETSPSPWLWMWYKFSPPTTTAFLKRVTSVTARDGGSFDQWNWQSGGDLLFQQNDDDSSCWDLPLPTSFEDMHDLYVGAFDKLIPSTVMFVHEGFGPTAGQTWYVRIHVTDRSLTSDELSPGTIPAPAAVLLSGLGAGMVGWLRRRRSL